jgi:isoamylase
MTSGSSAPLGATVRDGGVNFSLFSKDAAGIDLLLFDDADASRPTRVIPLDLRAHRTSNYWHVFAPGLGPGQIYGYRASGPFAPERGLRFDADKLLFDPYGRAMAVPTDYDRQAAMRPGDNTAVAMKSVVAPPDGYDWAGDEPLRRPFAETVIYEMHVRGFTRHPSSGVDPRRRGTYAGVIEKIPYLRDLGVTAVELLPIFQYDPQHAPNRTNYWGYQPLSFFAPHHAYSSRPDDPLGVLDEFREMVKALHGAGIEVILDVVFNHTAEGHHEGATQCYRGLANDVYYYLLDDRSRYADFSGCGNTLNANRSVVRRLIRDSLRYWVTEMHVDGFRFDLAAILSRDLDGHPQPHPPVLRDIESDPVLAGTKLIAEAWDAAGLFQVGSFAGDMWQEWNGPFRDDVRRFVRGDGRTVSPLATRLLGSPDLYGHEEREAEQSVNFITCHDGFTLNDLVSYNEKHNEANGEANVDGHNENLSWNCGVEGPTADPAVERLRNRQVKNCLAITLLAAGAPMLLMGDEVRRTQRGNNNAYCQDNEVSWFDWRLLDRHADVHRFVRQLIAFRQHRDVVTSRTSLSLNDLLRRVQIEWHGVELGAPDWGESSHSLAMTLRSLQARFALHAIFNAYWEPLGFALPPVPEGDGGWRRCLDTARESPHDVVAFDDARPVEGNRVVAEPRSVIVLARSIGQADGARLRSGTPGPRRV